MMDLIWWGLIIIGVLVLLRIIFHILKIVFVLGIVLVVIVVLVKLLTPGVIMYQAYKTGNFSVIINTTNQTFGARFINHEMTLLTPQQINSEKQNHKALIIISGSRSYIEKVLGVNFSNPTSVHPDIVELIKGVINGKIKIYGEKSVPK